MKGARDPVGTSAGLEDANGDKAIEFSLKDIEMGLWYGIWMGGMGVASGLRSRCTFSFFIVAKCAIK